MRFIFQIFVITFVIYSLFIVKDDIRGAYHRIASYIEEKASKSNYNIKDIFIGNDINVIEQTNDTPSSKISLTGERILSPKEKTDTPGPLRIIDGLRTSTTLSAKNIITISNKAREDNGSLKPLIENSKLNFSAEKKLQDMFMKQYFEHVSPTGVGVSDLGTQAGYEFILIGENLALGNFKDDQALVDAWMASPGHRANILNSHYTEIGVAVGKNTFEGKTIWMAVQHFGLPKSACPKIDSILSGVISLEKKKLSGIEQTLTTQRKDIEQSRSVGGVVSDYQIDGYNSLVNIYNSLIIEIKQKVAEYNKGVKLFNECVASHVVVAE